MCEGGKILSTVVIEISELRSRYAETVKELVEFLESKLGVKVDVSDREVKVESEKGTVSRDYLRVLLRKFLHREDLREEFRVISGPEKTLVIKERKIITKE